jgi:DNA polymerase-1
VSSVRSRRFPPSGFTCDRASVYPGAMSEKPSGPALLVDTYSLFFRAHHALPPMNTQSGAPTSALYGFSVALLKELRERQPHGIAFALDAPAKTFRHAEYPEYKGRRDAIASDLLAQFVPLRELIDAFGVPRFEVRGFEADDILATLAHALRARGEAVVIMSGDRDLLQLAYGGVQVLFVGARGQKPVLYDEAAVLERFGVPPQRLPDFAAFVGDSSDNLPGVPGVGPTTAAKWVQAYGGVPNVLAHAAELAPARLRSIVAERAEQIERNLRLATLRTDVPLPSGPPLGQLSSAGLGRVREMFATLEFKSLLPRLDALATPGSPAPGPPSAGSA